MEGDKRASKWGWVNTDGDKQKEISDAYLVLSGVEMVHVHERNGIAILIVIQQDADFIEQQFDIEFRYVLREVAVHDDLGFPHKRNDSVRWLAGYTGLKRGAHTTISSDGLQNELVIGGVGVFGNLGEGKSIRDPESTAEENVLSGTCVARAEGRNSRDNPEHVFGIGRWIGVWNRKANRETLTSPLNFWTASTYGNPAILAESVSK